jgi:hypothetical protein
MRKTMLLAALLAMLIVAAVPAVAQIGQENEQDAESGDVNQSFEVSSTGDNSNQCVGLQGVTNTGNAQNQIGVLQYGEGDGDDNDGRRDRDRDRDRNGGGGGDFEFDEVGSNIDVSPENSTTCDQQVNQAATAAG